MEEKQDTSKREDGFVDVKDRVLGFKSSVARESMRSQELHSVLNPTARATPTEICCGQLYSRLNISITSLGRVRLHGYGWISALLSPSIMEASIPNPHFTLP